MDAISFFVTPFIASLILVGIHTYLGLHVVERGVIFVDLALAQIAALGAAIAVLSGTDPESAATYWISLGFTFLGAAVFANVRLRDERIPQEAIIGISYAVAAAATILALSKAPSESDHLRDMLVGNLLFVTWPEVGKTALLYSAIGLFHYLLRDKFLAISMDHRLEKVNGTSVRVWDLLFYGSFGVVVTSSVAIAGVLLVFCYLIVPSVAGMLFAKTVGKRLLVGWSMGAAVSVLGMFLSLQLDLPTGATIACTFGLMLILMAAVKRAFRK